MAAKTTGLRDVQLKAARAEAHLLENNRLLIEAMLAEIKPAVIAQTPIGPGHFGYHTRDRITTDVRSKGRKSVGVVKSPVAGFWREYGTSRGERKFWTAHRAARMARKVVKAFYKVTPWWRL